MLWSSEITGIDYGRVDVVSQSSGLFYNDVRKVSIVDMLQGGRISIQNNTRLCTLDGEDGLHVEPGSGIVPGFS